MLEPLVGLCFAWSSPPARCCSSTYGGVTRESTMRPRTPWISSPAEALAATLAHSPVSRSESRANGLVHGGEGESEYDEETALRALHDAGSGTGGGGVMAESLSAEKVMEREMKRFRERYKRAQKEADEAKAQVEKLERALAMLRNSDKPSK
jgi:hypothetical protein